MPLESPEFPKEELRGRVICIGTSGTMEGKGGLAGIGVREGMIGMVDMDDRLSDRFGIDPIPTQKKHTGKCKKPVIAVRRQIRSLLY